MNYEILLNEAKEVIKEKISIGQKFEVKELFNGYDWDNIPKGNRIYFGKLFANEVRSGNVANVEPSGRANNNHLLYIKK